VGDRVVRGERGGVDEKAVVEVVGRERSGGSQVLARDVGCEARCGGGRVGCEGREEDSGMSELVVTRRRQWQWNRPSPYHD
jgi:hypothetical protein